MRVEIGGTGREILLRAIRNEVTSRPAWVPFVGVHGAKLIGEEASAYLHSADCMTRGLLRAAEIYLPDGLPVCFDLQLEAEVLGCRLNWTEDSPPSVADHPLDSGCSLSELPPFDPSHGRFPIVLEALRTLKREIGREVGLYGLVCGPFTLALHLMGNSIFLSMFDHPDYVKAVIAFCASVGTRVSNTYLENGADLIAVVDPMTSQISPSHFEEFVSGPLDLVFGEIRRKKGLSALFVCGDATRNLEVMSRTGCDNISIDENIPLAKVRDITRTSDQSFGGNLKLTSALLLGDEDDARLDAIRCIDIGGGCGFVLSPGCDLPYATPEANLRAVAEMAMDSYSREVAKRTIVAKSGDTVKPDLPDNYQDLPYVQIDVVTLDSASCAPCQYMMEAVRRSANRIKTPVIIKEHRIMTREGLSAMDRLGVVQVPTICINGTQAFASIIPDQHTLEARIEEAWNKMRNSGPKPAAS
jgi:uroporphyrinogen decarboxylase